MDLYTVSRRVGGQKGFINPPILLPNNNKNVLRWVCGVMQYPKREPGDTPTLGRLSAHGRGDVEEVDTATRPGY